MGASLPSISRWVESSPRDVSRLGLLYGANTAGAVLGCLAAGFYLLRVSNMTATTLVAAGINALVGIASLALARKEPVAGEAGVGKSAAAAPTSACATSPNVRPVYLTIALSGASALGAEVVWTRLLGLMLGATVYTFSIILAVFLVGLGIGSAGGALVSRRVDARAALGASQLALAAAIAWTAFMIGQSLPNWPVNPLLSTSPWFTFQIDLVRVIWALLPPTLLWGASFPLALAAAARPGEEPGRLVGARLCRQYLGRHFGRSDLQPDPDSGHRHGRLQPAAHPDGGARRPGGARAADRNHPLHWRRGGGHGRSGTRGSTSRPTSDPRPVC